jgi:hypothetical protein
MQWYRWCKRGAISIPYDVVVWCMSLSYALSQVSVDTVYEK